MVWELSFESFTLHAVNLVIQLHPQRLLQVFLSTWFIYVSQPGFFIIPWKLCAPTPLGLWPHSSQIILAPSLPNIIPLCTSRPKLPSFLVSLVYILCHCPWWQSLRLCTLWCSHHWWQKPFIVIIQYAPDNSKCKETWTRAKLGHRPSSLLTRSFLYPSVTSSTMSSTSKLKA